MNTGDHSEKYRFPWQYNNHFKLLVDGQVFFPSMLKAIHDAKHYILLEMYLIQSGSISQQFINALKQAADNDVKIFILLDDYGALDLKKHDRAKLIHPNIHLNYYNPLHLKKNKLLIFRDHRKILVVDGDTAFVGGAGITDQFCNPQQPQTSWRENMLEIHGANVHQWQSLFNANWLRWSEMPIPLRIPPEHHENHKGRVAMTEGPDLLEIKRSAINRIRNARNRVWLCTAYFVPSRKFRRVLRLTARRGIDVRLLIPGPVTDHPMARYLAQHYYSKLLKDNVRIFEYQPRFLHAKLILCDQWVSMGSCNIDRWNLRWNLDANQEIDDSDFASTVIEVFQHDFAQSKEIKLDAWKQRSMANKFAVWFWSIYIRLADLILTRLKILRHWKRFRKKRG